jgi:hypothetical protein
MAPQTRDAPGAAGNPGHPSMSRRRARRFRGAVDPGRVSVSRER